jgi:hypothetical protein
VLVQLLAPRAQPLSQQSFGGNELKDTREAIADVLIGHLEFPSDELMLDLEMCFIRHRRREQLLGFTVYKNVPFYLVGTTRYKGPMPIAWFTTEYEAEHHIRDYKSPGQTWWVDSGFPRIVAAK